MPFDPAYFDMLASAAEKAALQLRNGKLRVVFAESCTGGLLSAGLAQIPGASEFLCGSAIVYRAKTKEAWLDVPIADLKSHSAVSDLVTRHLAAHVLLKTVEAHCSCAITGHLGPDAPRDLDGVVFISIAFRTADGTLDTLRETRDRLNAIERVDRQYEAASLALNHLASALGLLQSPGLT